MLHWVLGGVGIVALLAIVLFPGFRSKLGVLFKGFLNIFVEDMAKTPEGAKAIYSQAIEEVQESYNRADNTLKKFAGELTSVQTEIKTLEINLKGCERNCENLIKRGLDEEARVYVDQRADILETLKRKRSYEEQLIPKVEEAKSVHELYGKKLQKLKRDSKLVVEEMKLNKDMKDLVSDLDDLKRDSATDKMLGAVHDASNDLRNEALGSMVVNANRMQTKLAKAEKAAAESSSDAYFEELKNKYRNTNNSGKSVASH